MARKRDKKEEKEADNLNNKPRARNDLGSRNFQEANYVSLKQQLSTLGLTLREIPGDGNCLFRALADQLDGTSKTHLKHRRAVVSYMRNHRQDFEPFVEDDVPFDRHLSNLNELGAYGGNECIVAFARLHKVIVVIHQLNTPLWQIDDIDEENGLQLHISFHNGDHYNSVRKIGDCSSIPPKIKLTVHEPICDTNVKKSRLRDKPNICYYQSSEYEASYVTSEDQNECLPDDIFGDSSKLDSDHQFEASQRHSKDHSFITQDSFDEFDCHYTPNETGIWSPNGTGRRILGINSPVEKSFRESSSREANSSNSTIETLQAKLKSNPHLSNSKRKELKKQVRKQQANERKKRQYNDKMYYKESYSENAEDTEAIVVKDLACLSI